MSTKGPAFLRARQPAQKQQRYQAILDAARTLAVQDGLGRVSLAGIAAGVGMHKSALLKYFGTREEIFLRLAETEWQEWAAVVVADLDAGPGATNEAAEHAAAEHVATTLTLSMAQRPLLCQLLTHTTLTLERNVSLDAVRRFKIVSMQAVDDVADALDRSLPALPRPACTELLMAGAFVAAGLWQVTHPPPIVLDLYAAPAAAPGVERFAAVEFTAAMTRFVRVYLAGLTHIDDQDGIGQ